MAKATFANIKIAILGGGHMGSALSEGLIRSGIQKSRIIVSRNKNKVAARSAQIIFLCVKPGVVTDVLQEISAEIQGKVVISAAAALSLRYLKTHAHGAHVARIMPNIPVSLNHGVVGFLPGTLTGREKALLKKLLSGLGSLIETKSDTELDALTLISGCGPGVVAYLIESFTKEASALGLRGARAEEVAFQTFKGTIEYMSANLMSAGQMREAVATKGGVTEAIIDTLHKKGFQKQLKNALSVGRGRIKKISR
ncbi:NAD(P)-binding domain-containing protein [Patescibacteria group bacterium]|nr:NAD(P)-binding domain-containing protein [Patescibacteria group bacterium]